MTISTRRHCFYIARVFPIERPAIDIVADRVIRACAYIMQGIYIRIPGYPRSHARFPSHITMRIK